MEIINFIIAVLALALAILAYRKAGGDMKSMKEEINSLREIAAEALGKVEDSIRPENKSEQTEKK